MCAGGNALLGERLKGRRSWISSIRFAAKAVERPLRGKRTSRGFRRSSGRSSSSDMNFHPESSMQKGPDGLKAAIQLPLRRDFLQEKKKSGLRARRSWGG